MQYFPQLGFVFSIEGLFSQFTGSERMIIKKDNVLMFRLGILSYSQIWTYEESYYKLEKPDLFSAKFIEIGYRHLRWN